MYPSILNMIYMRKPWLKNTQKIHFPYPNQLSFNPKKENEVLHMCKYNGIVVADLHIGAMNMEKQYNEIQAGLYASIRETPPDFLIFLGDYFDHKAALNDGMSYYSFRVFQDILKISGELGIHPKIRFIYGTESHEWDQYRLIENYDTEYDVKVVKTVAEEELFPNVKVLYIPEEHIMNKHDYYKDYLSTFQKYDYIFGHGVIREVMKMAAISNDRGSTTRKKVPVFSSGELNFACAGEVYFGHYHINSNINDCVFYVGSYSRWCHGEEEPKGFYEISVEVDSGGNIFSHQFIKNELAETYVTIPFGYDNPIFKDKSLMESKLDSVDKIVRDGVYDHVRYEFNIPPNAFDPEFCMHFLQRRYQFDKAVKVNIVHGYADEKKAKSKAEIETWSQENAPLFDRGLKVEDKVAFFLEKNYQKKFDKSTIRDYLTLPLVDLLKKENEEDEPAFNPPHGDSE